MHSCPNISVHFHNCYECRSYIRKAQFHANLISHDTDFTLICEKKATVPKDFFSKHASDLSLHFFPQAKLRHFN